MISSVTVSVMRALRLSVPPVRDWVSELEGNTVGLRVMVSVDVTDAVSTAVGLSDNESEAADAVSVTRSENVTDDVLPRRCRLTAGA